MSNGKTVLVTGAGRGIGKAIAVSLAKENYNVVVNSRNPEHANTGANEIKSLGKSAVGVGGDVAREDDCKNIIETTIKQFGSIDVLVNNAGIQKPIPVNDMSVEEWDKVMNVNLKGVFICSREAVKHMLKNGGGSIINISSVHQVIPKPLYVHYASSKGGLDMLTKTMALELARHNIRVNSVAPGAIATDMNKEIVDNPEKMKEINEQVPMGRIGKSEEVANVVSFLASDKASYVTGTTFFVDGGLTLYPSYGIELKEDSEEHH